MNRSLRSLVLGLVVIAAACSSGESGVSSTDIQDSETSVATTAAAGQPDDPVELTEPIVSGDDAAVSTVVSEGNVIPVDAPEFTPAPIDFERFDDAVDVGVLDVPVDYADPDGPRFELFVARYNAIDQDNKIGALLVNPGGPGFGGSDFAIFASQIFDRPLLDRFDIIGWDPRGTGESEPPIDCIDDYDPFFNEIDSTPETDDERALLVETAEEFASGCVTRSGDILQHVGTNSSARDVDTIRRSLGEDTISFFGFSYGSELGATWATMFPNTVRALVIDGASDPNADPLESGLQQVSGFEASLSTFLARCSGDDECAFNNDGDAEGAFDALLAEVDAAPLPSGDSRPPVNRDVAVTGIIQAMYSEQFWPALEQSLAAAQNEGDGSGLLALSDSYYQRGSDGVYGNELEAFQVITCADTAERQTIEETDAEAALYSEAAPRLVPEGSAGGYSCIFLPDALDPRIDITGAGAGPIVVIGTTGDPATPFDSTVRMSNTLEDGRLVIVEADQHTGYGVNRCVIDVVNAYLVDLTPPDDETECA